MSSEREPEEFPNADDFINKVRAFAEIHNLPHVSSLTGMLFLLEHPDVKKDLISNGRNPEGAKALVLQLLNNEAGKLRRVYSSENDYDANALERTVADSLDNTSDTAPSVIAAGTEVLTKRFEDTVRAMFSITEFNNGSLRATDILKNLAQAIDFGADNDYGALSNLTAELSLALSEFEFTAPTSITGTGSVDSISTPTDPDNKFTKLVGKKPDSPSNKNPLPGSGEITSGRWT